MRKLGFENTIKEHCTGAKFSRSLFHRKYLYKHQSIYLYKNGRTDVCLSVGMWRANGNPNSYTDHDEIFHAHPHLSKKGFGARLNPTALLPGLNH